MNDIEGCARTGENRWGEFVGATKAVVSKTENRSANRL